MGPTTDDVFFFRDSDDREKIIYDSVLFLSVLFNFGFYIFTSSILRRIFDYRPFFLCHLQPLDYEDTSQRPGFNLTVRVTDGRYFASAPVHLTLLDQNDNAPKIHPAPNVFLREDVRIGTNVTRFTATDPDLRDQERIE